MTCKREDLLGGVTVFSCSRGQRQTCGQPDCRRPMTKLCDFKLKGKLEGKTCDRPLCDTHAQSVGPNLDYCPAHKGLADKQAAK